MNEHVSLEIWGHISESYSAISEEAIYLFIYLGTVSQFLQTNFTGKVMSPCFHTFVSNSNNQSVILHSTICKHGHRQNHFQGGQLEKMLMKLHLNGLRIYFYGLP